MQNRRHPAGAGAWVMWLAIIGLAFAGGVLARMLIHPSPAKEPAMRPVLMDV